MTNRKQSNLKPKVLIVSYSVNNKRLILENFYEGTSCKISSQWTKFIA